MMAMRVPKPLRNPSLVIGGVIILTLVCLAVFAPVLIWNAQHDWVSLAFQSSRRVGEMGGFKPRYFLMLVATQFLLVTPYLFVLAMAALAPPPWEPASTVNINRFPELRVV